VRAGTYREWVKPPRGGTSEARRIVYRAAPGETVIIRGSERVTSWTPQHNGIWKLTLPDAFFGDYNPYKENIKGGWLLYGQEAHLGDVYLNGKSFQEKLALDGVVSTPMSFTIEGWPESTLLYANFGGADPNAEMTEINVRECVFFPVVKGLGFITIDGFTMQHAAANWACFRAFQRALLGTYYGKNWIIQNNHITDARCAGIVCGNDPSHENEAFVVEETGHHVVRNNTIQRCGQAGIHGFKGWAASIIENNLIEDINTKDDFAAT
ncbi:unnamed protein product, partial [marine sediment metagenome]